MTRVGGTLKEVTGLSNVRNERVGSITRFDFAVAVHREALLRDGFHVAEDGNVWTGAKTCRLMLPAHFSGEDFQIRFSIVPLCLTGGPRWQRLSISLNGFNIGSFRCNTETTLTMILPSEYLHPAEDQELLLALPDAVELDRLIPGRSEVLGCVVDMIEIEPVGTQGSISNLVRYSNVNVASAVTTSQRFLDVQTSELPVVVESVLGVQLPDLFRRFESIGDSCTFGLAQRKVGLEVLNLLRFANAPISATLRALRDGFSLATEGSEIAVDLESGDPREFVIRIRRYGIRWHTFMYETAITAEQVHADNVGKLAYLRRKFYEGLQSGRKIYVLTRLNSRRHPRVVATAAGAAYSEAPLEPLQLNEAVSVWQEINRKNRNTLLYVVPSTNQCPSGTVELLCPGLLRGYIDNSTMRADLNIGLWDHSDWIRMIGNAWFLAGRK